MNVIRPESYNRYGVDFAACEDSGSQAGLTKTTVAPPDASVNDTLEIQILSERPFHATAYCAAHITKLGLFTHQQLSRAACPYCVAQNAA